MRLVAVTSHLTSGEKCEEKCEEIVKTLHVKFFSFGVPARKVAVKQGGKY